MQFNIPILLTFLRIVIVPFFILTFYCNFIGAHLICSIIFIIASLTDLFDGFLARRWKQSTKLGAFLDPIADKLIVSTAFILITEYYHVWWITLAVIIMISREIIIIAIRKWMAEIENSKYISVSQIGKLKTFTQMLAISLLLWNHNIYIFIIGVFILYLATILTVLSMFLYFNSYFYLK